MTTLAITAAQAAGSTLTSTLVSTASNLALSSATNAISRVFDNRVFEGPRLESFHLQTSRDGAPMARIYGRVRLAGQVIWASRIREIATEERVSSGKGGGPRQRNFSYTISFAIGLCEGEILGVDRLWANGQILQYSGLTMRVYTGSDTQLPDPIIAATERGAVPAFRGCAYIVFEDFPLDDFGARLPQINVEAVRVPPSPQNQPRLEHLIKSVCLLPGSGEFSYAPDIIEASPRPGVSEPVNMNNLSGLADMELALDQLETQLPNCKNVSIISAWFGTDLRCGACEIKPGVERRRRVIRDVQWQVGRDDRGNAYLVSLDNQERPNFGGTPSDQSLIDAIRWLKARGFSVTLYPFILMDIPPNNRLHDPDGAGFQAPFPWRGRIRSTQDKSAQTRAQIEAFFGTAQPADFSLGAGRDHHRSTDYRYRHFILHHANIARRAGGVARFIIGSEMRSLTTLRDQFDNFPAVEQFIRLARDVRTMLGRSTALSYAADWTEYFGYHPQDGSGDVFYHLDDLWADQAIDAVGIDAYFPLSDWREGSDHADSSKAQDIYDQSYLAAQIEGGEGYEYFYASNEARDAQIRSPITDGHAHKPWVFRYKDVRNWWNNAHYERRDGVELPASTAWRAQSKPIWFTEIGCPAIHFGANQPNVFSDPKSAESQIPYFSNGSRDDLIQRQYLEALIGYWDDRDINPISPIYNRAMIDTDMMSVWAWDARPFPDFPARQSVWSDGGNWEIGHWITGRMGLMPIRYILEDLSMQAGLDRLDVSGVNGVVQGYHIDRPMSARAALSPIMDIMGIDLSECGGDLTFASTDNEAVQPLDAGFLARHLVRPIEFTKADADKSLRDLRLHFIDIAADYQLGSISARQLQAETVRVADIRVPIAMDQNYARFLADQNLEDHQLSLQSLTLSLSPLAALTFQTGQHLSLEAYEGVWRVDSLDIGDVLDMSLTRISQKPRIQSFGNTPQSAAPVIFQGRPACFAFDIPGNYSGPLIGAVLSPYYPVTVTHQEQAITLNSALHMGALLSDLKSGPIGRWDRQNSFELYMADGQFSALQDGALLAGGNKFAIETVSGWEIIQIRNMSLIGADRYHCAVLLRGLDGSAPDMPDVIAAGARVIWLNRGVADIALDAQLLQEHVSFQCAVNGRQGDAASLHYTGRALRPLAPVHLRNWRQGGAHHLRWIRQSRIDADSWAGEVPLGEAQELYRIQFFENDTYLSEVTTQAPHYQWAVSDSDLGRASHVSIAQFSNIFGWGARSDMALTR